MIKKKIVVIGAFPDSLLNFRGKLLQQFFKLNFEVFAMAAPTNGEQVAKMEAHGAVYVEYPIQRNGLNPIYDIKTWWVLKRELKKINPDVVLAYTIKPVIWGGLASLGLKKTKFYALITGLGYAFQGQGFRRTFLKKMVSLLYRTSLSRATGVIFQNKDDLETFVELKIVPFQKCFVVSGSGVDTEHFSVQDSNEKSPTFITVARLLVEKGLRVYMDAAYKVKKRYPGTIFRMLGSPDPSPDGISLEEVMRWSKDGIVEYLGEADDVRPHLAACNIFVLASYYGEGLPRTIIEAMAMGKPILTTDNVGCRETVVEGENGFLVPVKDSDALAERMIWFIENQDEWKRMGSSSRRLALERFDVDKVNSQMLKIMGLLG